MDALKILQRINGFIFLVSITGAVLILIYLGTRYFMSKGGDVDKIHASLRYIVIGIILLIVAGTIPTLLISFLKGKT